MHHDLLQFFNSAKTYHLVRVGVRFPRSGLVGQVQILGGWLVRRVHVQGDEDLVILPTIRSHLAEGSAPHLLAEANIKSVAIKWKILPSDIVEPHVEVDRLLQNDVQCLQCVLRHLPTPAF